MCSIDLALNNKKQDKLDAILEAVTKTKTGTVYDGRYGTPTLVIRGVVYDKIRLEAEAANCDMSAAEHVAKYPYTSANYALTG